MSKIEDGGPAFPVSDIRAAQPEALADMKRIASGMTLRDYFAAKAMQGEVAACQNQRAKADDVAEFAYRVADAMLRARTQEPSQ